MEVIPSASHRDFTARALAITSYVLCQLNGLLFSFLGRAYKAEERGGVNAGSVGTKNKGRKVFF